MPSIPPPTEFSRLGQVRVPRIWTGLWQLSSSAWGSADITDIKKDMRTLVDNGYCYFGMNYRNHSLDIIAQAYHADMVGFGGFCFCINFVVLNDVPFLHWN